MNWFRKGPDGKFVWPGFGENMRVLRWMLGRIDGQAQGVDQVFGVSPSYQDIDWTGLEFTPDKFEQIMSVDEGAWRAELALHGELFGQLARACPKTCRPPRSRSRGGWRPDSGGRRLLHFPPAQRPRPACAGSRTLPSTSASADPFQRRADYAFHHGRHPRRQFRPVGVGIGLVHVGRLAHLQLHRVHLVPGLP